MAMILKKLSHDAIPRALERADRYRLLNEPVQAESICLDILAVDPDNQDALRTLLLALTDQFGHGYQLAEIQPKNVIARLKSEYEREYYTGIVAERRAKEFLDQHSDPSGHTAHDFLTSALAHYERAADLRPPGNDDALLRWNTCARLLNSHGVHAPTEEPADTLLE